MFLPAMHDGAAAISSAAAAGAVPSACSATTCKSVWLMSACHDCSAFKMIACTTCTCCHYHTAGRPLGVTVAACDMKAGDVALSVPH